MGSSPAPSSLAKLICLTPAQPYLTPGLVFLCTAISIIVVDSSLSSFLTSLPLLHDLRSRNQVTPFLISLPFRRSQHSFTVPVTLLESINKSLLQRAGFRFNSRYDLKSPRFIVRNTAAISHVCLFPIVRRPKQTGCYIHFESAFVPCPVLLELGLPHAISIHNSLHYRLEFTLPQLPIVLSSTVLSFQSVILLPTLLLLYMYTHLTPTSSLTKVLLDPLSLNLHIYQTYLSSPSLYIRIAFAILCNATFIPGFGPGGPQP